MPLERELSELAALVNYLNEAPKGLKTTVFNDEIAQRLKKVDTEIQHPYPLMELHWLKYHEAQALQPKLISSTKHAVMLQDRMRHYGDAMLRCEGLIKPFAQKNRAFIDNPVVLSAKIKEQQDIIFQQYLNDAINLYLLRGADKQSEASEVTAEKILKHAIASYKTALDRETLYFFEMKCLIERHALLEEKKADGLKNLVIEHHVLTYETAPELAFIEAMLKKEGLALFDYKLEGTASLFSELEYPGYSTLRELNECLEAFFNEYGEKNIDPATLHLKNSNIRCRKISLYFANPDLSTVRDELTTALENFKTFEASLHLPSKVVAPIVLETHDKNLLSLRRIVASYHALLDNIEQEEKNTYTARNEEHLKHRRQALNTLEHRINKEATLTPEMRILVKVLVDDIISNKPHWKELPLIDKILDIISLGLHALIRNSRFKEHKETIALEKLAQVTPKEENDQSDKDDDITDSGPL